MKTCDIRCTPLKGGNFTVEEVAWLDGFLPQVQELTANKGLGAGKDREDFYDRIEQQFLAKFVYHVPDCHTGYKFTQEQKECAWDDREATMLRSRLRTKLSSRARKMGDGHTDSPAQSKRRKESDFAARDEEAIAEQPSGRSANRQDLDELSQTLEDLGPFYMWTMKTIARYEQAVRDVCEMVGENWAELPEKLLRKRQAKVFPALATIIHFLGEATGTEIHANLVWHDGQTTVSGLTPEGEASHQNFLEYARENIGRTTIVPTCGAWCNRRANLCDVSGSGITTNIAEAEATVTGDPLRSERPKLAPLKHDLHCERREQLAYFQGLWRTPIFTFYHGLLTRDLEWQGGATTIPWDRLETDGRSGAYCLIDHHRLPAGETMIWADALRSPNYTGSLEFQFRQPYPGIIFEETQNQAPKKSRLTYPPEALAYTRRQILENDSARLPWSGHPFGSSAGTELFNDTLKGWAAEVAGGDETMIDLVQFAEEYEHFMPYQATHADFEHVVTRCEALASRLPKLAVGPGPLCADMLVSGFHLEEGSPEHEKIIEWTADHELRHTSDTTMGGEWGVKWIVVLLLILWSGTARDSTRNRLRGVAHEAQMALAQSIQTLGETLSQHRGSSANTGGCASLWDIASMSRCVVKKRSDDWTRKNVIVMKNPPAVQTHGAEVVGKIPQKRSHKVMAGTS
ncbi:hypothetical protein FRC10_004507, partial [Ceratobasidium sp. 414]